MTMDGMDQQFRESATELHSLIGSIAMRPASDVIRRHRRQRMVMMSAAAVGSVAVAYGISTVPGGDRSNLTGESAAVSTNGGPPTTTLEIDGVSVLGAVPLSTGGTVGIGLTANGAQMCLVSAGAALVCDDLPRPVNPITLPTAHAVVTHLVPGGPAIVWGVIQDGYRAAVGDATGEIEVAVTDSSANGLSGFAQVYDGANPGARLTIRDVGGAVRDAVDLSAIFRIDA